MSIINITEELNSPHFPFVVSSLKIAILSEREEHEEAEIETQIEAKIGESSLFDAPLKVDFKGRKKCRSMIDLQGFVIPEPGELNIRHKMGERELAVWSIMVNKIGTPKADLFSKPEGAEE